MSEEEEGGGAVVKVVVAFFVSLTAEVPFIFSVTIATDEDSVYGIDELAFTVNIVVDISVRRTLLEEFGFGVIDVDGVSCN